MNIIYSLLGIFIGFILGILLMLTFNSKNKNNKRIMEEYDSKISFNKGFDTGCKEGKMDNEIIHEIELEDEFKKGYNKGYQEAFNKYN